ncbi:uncharacterized protein DSM5745_02733 [Aspergillus mulundensis]|uniref:Uncharacterized protein n=1 Tax=Aspergillus mulundensis TaxID=1810919 RepID=A0A3D8SIT3_9EURO|nr:Uncharacterized protein DSM5745_02733 [Aspergillus mulundensis]RDW86091.1 Uncharacterized protein DSM5745_02733 [Aspergillus mulundensis]
MRPYTSLLLTTLSLPGALSNFLGPIYPAPRDLTSSNSLVAAAWKNLTISLDRSLHGQSNSTLSEFNDLTFSVGLFSTRDSKAEKLQYHHAAPETRNASFGTQTVDGDSIYRVASVSKLFTVLAGLIELDLEEWERPLSEIFPEFAHFVREKSNTLDPIYDTQWNAITPFALASQMGGISQYGAPWTPDYLALYVLEPLILGTSSPEYNPATYGFPPVDPSDPANHAPCTTPEGFVGGICDPESYAEGASTNPPIALPWTSPVYSNNGFTLLGMAIANLTGKTLDDVYQESIFDPLNMTSSYSVVPPNSTLPRSVVAGEPQANFAIDNGLSKSSGGIFSTLNDLAKFSTAILNSTLLDTHTTHRWMKPVTHTSDLHYAIGAPWEIYRYEHPETGLVTDIYTKLGDSGSYGAMTLFIPDFDAGLNLITASTQATRSQQTLDLVQAVIGVFLPALTKQAARELEQKYTGTYVSATPGLNSSLTLTPSKIPTSPGLSITSWIQNSTDVLSIFYGSPIFPTKATLRPLITPHGSNQIAFRLATTPADPVLPRDPSNLFSAFYDADQFAQLGQYTYANLYIGEFVFEIQEDGRVSGVTPAAWVGRLEKV